jgi:alpha-amylase
MPKTIRFVFGLHCHQPVGNFDQVFRQATEKSYRPFLQALERHPSVKVTLHYTGILLDWLKRNDPALIGLIRSLVARGQVEMMTGGFYEPILAVIPDADKLGQIRKQTAWLKQELGADARGLWLAERVWEPQLPAALRQAGVEFLTLDDSHFKASGVSGDALYGRYVTEELGQTVEVFPILEPLRYLIPFRPAQETIDFLASIATEDGSRVAVMADDGEKFGVWPDTYGWVFEQGWLEDFFSRLEANASWLKTTSFAEARAATAPLGRIYLPTASYTEMMEWALPAASAAKLEEAMAWVKRAGHAGDYGVFLRGGFWRNFFAKYDESNSMHKKMLDTGRRVEALQAKDPALAAAAREHLWAGQCNCAYWHGVFGGLYLNHLRSAIYRELVAADAMAHRALQGSLPFAGHRRLDFDADGREELILESDKLFVALDPARGGRLFELDDRDRAFNLGDTMTRRREAYHAKLLQSGGGEGSGDGVASIHDRVRVKEPGLEKLLVFDPGRRASLVDHFLPLDEPLEAFAQARSRELGDFWDGAYSAHAEGGSATLQRLGSVDGQSVHVSKSVAIKPGSAELSFLYRVENRSEKPLKARLGVEFNFGLLAGDAPDRYYKVAGAKLEGSRFNSFLELGPVSEAALVDEWLDLALTLRFAQKADLGGLPIETISQSEGGFERVYQNTLLLPRWSLDLAPGTSAGFEFTLSLEKAR